MFAKKLRKKLPVIVTDIDGVLIRGKTPIPNTLPALQLIKSFNLPFTCLTNGGGCLEQVKAQKLNQIFQLKQNYFNAQNMILNHTPLKPSIIKQSKNGLILITGSKDVISIVENLKISNFITADEIYALGLQQHPQILKLQVQRQDFIPQQIKNTLKKRFNNQIHDTQWYFNNIKALFALNDVSPYECALEVISNIYSYKLKNNQQIPNYYAAQNDMIWASTFPLPRMAMGPFTYILKNHCEKFINFQLKPIIYGKPTLNAFTYVEDYMKSLYPECGNFYMIGDNPKADIRGANLIGWTSILTRTGIFKGEINDEEDPAKIVVNDFSEAIRKIFQIEDII